MPLLRLFLHGITVIYLSVCDGELLEGRDQVLLSLNRVSHWLRSSVNMCWMNGCNLIIALATSKICLPRILCLLFSPGTWFTLTKEPCLPSLHKTLAQMWLLAPRRFLCCFTFTHTLSVELQKIENWSPCVASFWEQSVHEGMSSWVPAIYRPIDSYSSLCLP